MEVREWLGPCCLSDTVCSSPLSLTLSLSLSVCLSVLFLSLSLSLFMSICLSLSCSVSLSLPISFPLFPLAAPARRRGLRGLFHSTLRRGLCWGGPPRPPPPGHCHDILDLPGFIVYPGGAASRTSPSWQRGSLGFALPGRFISALPLFIVKKSSDGGAGSVVIPKKGGAFSYFFHYFWAAARASQAWVAQKKPVTKDCWAPRRAKIAPVFAETGPHCTLSGALAGQNSTSFCRNRASLKTVRRPGGAK